VPDDLETASWVEVDADPAHVRREREKARRLRASAWWRRRLQRGVCAYCGEKFEERDLTMDHVVPVARGGRSTKGNVVASCKECNTRKKLLTPAERLLLVRRIGEASPEDGDE
jgi:5-methylcytosine-specific restriction endonuclease McrA